MPRLVLLTEGFTGRSHELKMETTTVGRVDDNAFQIPEASVSSHHCEILQRGSEIVVKDLNSTNGTFINGNQITEGVLKPGQILKLGNVEMRLESGAPTAKKLPDQTMVIPQGVKLGEEQTKPTVFAGESPFTKKSNKATLVFVVIGSILGLIILGIIVYAVVRIRAM
jgi:pSer/pThr/pTyr-binding forkhead associated (FHA) protein